MDRPGCPHIQTVVRIAGQTPADAKCATSGLFEKASLGDLPVGVAGGVPEAVLDSHNAGYVNRFVRGLQASARFRFSSTVDPPGRITRFVGKQDPVASDFEAISSP